MSASLVGSEMCIRDSSCTTPCGVRARAAAAADPATGVAAAEATDAASSACLLYTSDAADDM
eukprot:11711251-Alexandrium_andersonii.AAC.1